MMAGKNRKTGKECQEKSKYRKRTGVSLMEKENEKKTWSVDDRRLSGGVYCMDYSRQYGKPCDIREKARMHMQRRRNVDGRSKK